MKLFYSPNSPYARKCRVVILEKGLQNRVELISCMPSDNPPELIVANPLGTVPTLVMDDGKSLCESPVICEYLDSLVEKNPLFSTDKTGRFEALAIASLADGIMDAAVACVMEGRRPEEKRYDVLVKRKEIAILRTINMLSQYDFYSNDLLHIGTINAAVALAYINFRLPHLSWNNEYNHLFNWLEYINKNQSMLETMPVL